MNRPVFKVINNNLLLAIAQSKPNRPEDLQNAGLTVRQIQIFGNDENPFRLRINHIIHGYNIRMIQFRKHPCFRKENFKLLFILHRALENLNRNQSAKLLILRKKNFSEGTLSQHFKH